MPRRSVQGLPLNVSMASRRQGMKGPEWQLAGPARRASRNVTINLMTTARDSPLGAAQEWERRCDDGRP